MKGAPNTPGGGSGGDADSSRDSDDQRRLRQIVLEEIEQVMKRHDVGGVAFVASQDSAAWRFVLPRWGGVTYEGPGVMRVRISSRTPALRALADSTMHYVAGMRDMCMHAALLFSDLFDQSEQALGGKGSIVHRPLHFGRADDKAD